MLNTIEQYLSNINEISKISISILVSSGIAGLINYLIKKWLDLKYLQNLETFKQDLKIIEKEAENEFRKKIGSYDIYIQKRHLALSIIYENLLTAEGKILSLYGLKQTTDYKSIPTDSLISIVEEKVTENTLKENIKNLLLTDNEKNVGIFKLENFLRNKEFYDARISNIELGNSILSNKLYLPENIDILLESIFNKIRTIFFKYEQNHFNKIKFDYKEIETLKTEITVEKNKLINQMKHSLSGTFEI